MFRACLAFVSIALSLLVDRLVGRLSWPLAIPGKGIFTTNGVRNEYHSSTTADKDEEATRGRPTDQFAFVYRVLATSGWRDFHVRLFYRGAQARTLKTWAQINRPMILSACRYISQSASTKVEASRSPNIRRESVGGKRDRKRKREREEHATITHYGAHKCANYCYLFRRWRRCRQSVKPHATQ